MYKFIFDLGFSLTVFAWCKFTEIDGDRSVHRVLLLQVGAESVFREAQSRSALRCSLNPAARSARISIENRFALCRPKTLRGFGAVHRGLDL